MNEPAVDHPQLTGRARHRRRPWTGVALALAATIAVALVLSGCGGRLGRDATPSSSTAPTTAAPASDPSTVAARAPTTTVASTADIEADLNQVQADLDGAQHDLQDGATEATTNDHG